MKTAVAAALFAAIALMIDADLAADYRAGSEPVHLMAEALVMLVAVAGAALLWGQLRSARREQGGPSQPIRAGRVFPGRPPASGAQR